MKQPKTIMWFRQDLRLHDNPALTAAIQHGDVLPIYILDDDAAGEHQLGGASRWWLHHSLASLHQSLSGTLSFYRGNASDIIAQLIEHYPIEAVYWNRCYEPWRQHRDQQIKSMLQDHGITVDSFNGSLLWEPWTIKKNRWHPLSGLYPLLSQRLSGRHATPLATGQSGREHPRRNTHCRAVGCA